MKQSESYWLAATSSHIFAHQDRLLRSMTDIRQVVITPGAIAQLCITTLPIPVPAPMGISSAGTAFKKQSKHRRLEDMLQGPAGLFVTTTGGQIVRDGLELL